MLCVGLLAILGVDVVAFGRDTAKAGLAVGYGRQLADGRAAAVCHKGVVRSEDGGSRRRGADVTHHLEDNGKRMLWGGVQRMSC